MQTATVPLPSTDASPATAWRAYQGVTPGAIDEKDLIERHLSLVRNVVDRIKLNLPAHVDPDDLYSVGVTGLIAAVRKFNPEQSSTFATYASTRIRGAILDELRRLDWCPRRSRARSRKLKQAIDEVEQKLGRTATEVEMCEALGLDRKEYAKWLEEARPVTFLAIDRHAENEEGEGDSLHEVLADEQDTTGRERMEKRELLELLTQRLAQLPDIPRKILAMYYFENLRLAEIAAVFGLTESRICQIHAQAILGLRAYLQRVRDR